MLVSDKIFLSPESRLIYESQCIRNQVYKSCLEKVKQMDISKIPNSQIKLVAYRIGSLAYSQFKEVLHAQYKDDDQTVLNIIINNEKYFFTGSGASYLPSEIISALEKKAGL
jgi:hypothetical protein